MALPWGFDFAKVRAIAIWSCVNGKRFGAEAETGGVSPADGIGRAGVVVGNEGDIEAICSHNKKHRKYGMTACNEWYIMRVMQRTLVKLK